MHFKSRYILIPTKCFYFFTINSHLYLPTFLLFSLFFLLFFAFLYLHVFEKLFYYFFANCKSTSNKFLKFVIRMVILPSFFNIFSRYRNLGCFSLFLLKMHFNVLVLPLKIEYLLSQ